MYLLAARVNVKDSDPQLGGSDTLPVYFNNVTIELSPHHNKLINSV